MTLHCSDATMCRQCKGLCCQGHAGVWVDPLRFERLFYGQGRVDPDRLPKGIILRDLGGIAVAAPDTAPHGCTFLTGTGCSLATDRRPCQCLALQPRLETLLEGEMRCTLPPECGSQTARENWQRYWSRNREDNTP